MGTSDTERKGTASAHPGGSSHSTRRRKGEKRGKPPNTALFQPRCELPSATAELNKTHTWFIFGLALPPPLPSPIDLRCYCSVLCPDTPKALSFAALSLLLRSRRCNCCNSAGEGEEGEGGREPKTRGKSRGCRRTHLLSD